MPLISVIMPSYNVCTYIEECIKSVCNQTLKDIEILSIDAGSTDGTLDILREYEKNDFRVKVILSEQKSYGYQVNKGIDLAQGEYIAVIETDDFIEINMLEVLYKYAKENSLDYVKGDYYALIAFENSISWKQAKRIYPLKNEMYYKVVSPREDLNTFLQDVFLWRGIYRKDFLVENNIKLNDTAGAAYQDVGFLFQTIVHANRAMYIPDIIYNYRQNNGNSSVYNSKAYDYLLGEYPFVERKLQESDLFYEEIKNCYYARLFVQIITRYKTMAVSGGVWNNTEMQRQKLWNIIRYAYQEGYLDEALFRKDLWMELQKYLQSEEDYWQNQLFVCNSQKKYLQEFLNKVKTAESLVFYSKSIVGGFVCSLLSAAGISKSIYFCDNDEKKQGTQYMNYPIVSVEEAVARKPRAIYIIANRNFNINMRNQLMELGINKSQICIWMLDENPLLLQLIE